jgi:hypothetical protein
MGLGRLLGAKLFLEGKEVPLIGATIHSTVGSASIAYIDVVPHQKINNIKPRTTAQIFVRNFLDDGTVKGSSAFPYVLAWEGEVFGYGFGRTTQSRTFSLSCIDYSSFWDNCLAYFFNSQQTLGGGGADKTGSGVFDTADAQKMQISIQLTVLSKSTYFKTKFQQILKTAGSDFLDAFVGLYNEITNVNDFYRMAEERLRITDRIIIHSSKQLDNLLKGQEALDWFEGITSQNSGYTSVRAIIQDLMSIIFHDFVSISFPAAVSHKFSNGGTPLPSIGSSPKTIGTFLFKPNIYMIPPPMCNVFFPDEYSSFQFNRNFFKEPTRLIYQPELPARLGSSDKVCMRHSYQPDSFNNFMLKTGSSTKYQGKSSIFVPQGTDPGFFWDDDKGPSKTVTDGKKRDGQFLTNEEWMKGIWLSRESMMPAATEFRITLDDTGKTADFSNKIAKYLFFKKRFQDRQLQITSHLKMSVVPGFPVLILDDSDADQTVIAYCSGVTHRIYATEGGYTNVHLSYARYVAEEDVSSSFGVQYLIPPWLNKEIFGEMTTPPQSESSGKEVETLGVTLVTPPKLSEFYATLLGEKGSKAISNYFKNEPTLVGSVRKLSKEYRLRKEKGANEVQRYIAEVTSRAYIKMKDAMDFIGTTTKSKNVEDDSWIEFKGDAFNRTGKLDENASKVKQKVVTEYRDILKKQRGFRG